MKFALEIIHIFVKIMYLDLHGSHIYLLMFILKLLRSLITEFAYGEAYPYGKAYPYGEAYLHTLKRNHILCGSTFSEKSNLVINMYFI